MEDKKKFDTASAIKLITHMGYTCEVKLTRLTRQEIEKYTKRKERAPDKQLNNIDSPEKKGLQEKLMSLKKKRARVIYSSDDETTSNSSDTESVKQKRKKYNHIKYHSPKKTLNENSVLSNTKNSSEIEKSTFTNNINKSHNTKNCSEIEKSTFPNSINKSRSIQVHNLKEGVKCPVKVHRSDSSSKKKRKMALLFGDDYDEIDEMPKIKSDYESKKHLGQRPTITAETVNFNVFLYKGCVSDKNDGNMHKSVNSIHHKTNEKQWKENSYKHVHGVHKSKHTSKIECDKKSTKYDNRIKKAEIKCIESSKLYTEVIKNNTVVEHLPKNESDKIKLKSGESLPKSQSSPKRNDSENLNNSALLQGIWSSLGMQSPADRSDKIISSTAASETCTLYKATNSENDVLLASGIGSELHKNNTVKYKDNSSENNGRNQVSVIQASCLSTDKETNGVKKCIMNTDSVNLNKDKEKKPTPHSRFTSDRGNVFERNIEVSENSRMPSESNKKQECRINGSNKNVDSCNPVKIPKPDFKSGYEGLEVPRRISNSETCSTTSAVKSTDDKQCIENYHKISTDSVNCTNNPISCSIDLCDSADETSTPETLSSGIPASVGSTSGTESCNIGVLGTMDEIEDVGSCSSVEFVETDANNLVTCHSDSASKNNNLLNTGTSNNENLVSSAGINILTCESNIASEKKNNPKDAVLNENENLIQNTVVDTSKYSTGVSNSECSAIFSGTVTNNNNNIGKIRVKDPKSLGIQSFGISSSGQCAIVVAEQTRQSVENNRNSVEESRRKSIEETKRKSVEETRRKSAEENKEKSVEENRRKSVEEQRRLSIEDNRRQLVEERRRLSIEEHRKQLVEDMTIEQLIASSSIGQNFSESDVVILRNYKKYFNELIESKLPKMGELLDLAVADSVRKDVRIQHSEKLSSPDLVKQEKLKAEKEYSDSLKIRGIEFTALLDSIIMKFDAQCTEDMVFALYSRILDVFKLIDKQNKKHIPRTKVIIQKMLQKNCYRNESVFKILSKKTCDFSQSLSRISHFILIYNNMVKAALGNHMLGTQSTVDTIRSVQALVANAGMEGTVTGATTVESFSHSGKGASGPRVNECSTSEVHAPLQPQNSVQINTSGSIQTNTSGSVVDQHNSGSSFSWDLFFSGVLENMRHVPTSNTATATVPNQRIIEYNYNRTPENVMNRPGGSQYANQLPSCNSQPLSSVDKGGTAVNQNLSNLYYGSKSVTNPGTINHVNNIDTNSSLMHLQKLNDQTTASRTRHTNAVIRRNIFTDQQMSNSINQHINQLMRKCPVQLNSNSSSMNSTALVRNQSAVMQTNGNNISPNTINEANRNNQQYQNLSLSRQESNSSRMNVNHSNMPTMVMRGGTDTSDRISQQANFPLLRNQNNMQPAVNMHKKLINHNQAAVGIHTNTMYVNNVQQVENAGRVPVNWQSRDFVINNGVVTTMSGQSTAPNRNYSQLQVTSNANYSNQNKDYVNMSNVSSVETASMQSNKLPQQQANANIQNKNIGPQAGGVVRSSSMSNQKMAGSRPPPPPYSDLLLKHLLETDKRNMFPESETLKKVIEDRVYLQKQSVEAGNQNIASREMMQQNGNAAPWNVSVRPVSNCPIQSKGNSLYNIGCSSTLANISVVPSTINTQTLTAVNTNPNEISYQRIRLVGGVHNMKSHRNVAIAPRPVTSNSIQSIPTSKTQDRLPVISEVFTCGNLMLEGQKDTASVTNSAVYSAPVNTSSPSTSQPISTTMLSQLNSNCTVQRQSTEVVPVSSSVRTISPQNCQLIAPNNNTSPLIPSAVSASTNAVTSNYQLVYSNNDQSAPQSNGYNFNITSVVNNANAVSAHASGQSVPSLPCSNSNDIVTLADQSEKSVNAATDGNSFNLPSVIIHHLPDSNIGEVSITGDHIETELALESGSLTCARGGCNQKSNKLCSVCKCTTYCSFECQTEDWYNGHAEKCRAP